MSSDPPQVRELWPLLSVRDIGRSIAFYTETLGFVVAGQAEGEHGIFWCRLRRDGVSFMLQQRESTEDPPTSPGAGVGFYFVCRDVDRMHAELVRNGLALDPPVEAYYGMKQLPIPDPDGYTVVFESPTASWSG